MMAIHLFVIQVSVCLSFGFGGSVRRILCCWCPRLCVLYPLLFRKYAAHCPLPAPLLALHHKWDIAVIQEKEKQKKEKEKELQEGQYWLTQIVCPLSMYRHHE